MKRLEGKTALVTGGAAGIGAAAAEAFCAEGAAVMLVDTDAARLAATAAAIRTRIAGARIATHAADVSDGAQATVAVQRAIAELGTLDVLVNNAAMRRYGSIEATTPADWHAMAGVNLVGIANYCKAALPALRRSGRGSIVNVSSCHAVTGRKGMGIYDATKAGILSITRTLAIEEASHGIRANAVCPGPTLTDFHVERAAAAGKSLETLKEERRAASLIGRWAEPREVAMPILWLASDEASFITGATLMVDGGLTIM
jgi:2-hydroxycyclohexanecarboxyl-CoA dehydrogenase